MSVILSGAKNPSISLLPLPLWQRGIGLRGVATAMHALGTKIAWYPIFATALPSH